MDPLLVLLCDPTSVGQIGGENAAQLYDCRRTQPFSP